MLEKPKIISGDGVTLFKNSNSKVLENMKELTCAGKAQYSIKQNKVISQSIIPGTNWNVARQSFFTKESAWTYTRSENEKKIVNIYKEIQPAKR